MRNRSWFDKGGRHGLSNRIDDIRRLLDHCDTSDMTAVDLGAAEGDISVWLSKKFKHVTSVELMDRAYEILVTRASEVSNITPVQGDVRSWRAPQSYDCVFLLGVLHFFPEDRQKEDVLHQSLSAADYGCFVRTGIREHKIRDGLHLDKLEKYTPLHIFEAAAATAKMEMHIIDNSWRGQNESRLGDLVYFRKKVEDNILPSTSIIEETFSKISTHR